MMDDRMQPFGSDHGDGERGRARRRRARPSTPRTPDSRPPELEKVLDALESAGASAPAPDVSEAVLRRLGYVASTRRAVRRQRVRDAARRVATVGVFVGVLGAGWWWIDGQRREHARIAGIGAGVDDVVRTSFERSRDRVGEVVERMMPTVPFGTARPASPAGQGENGGHAPGHARPTLPIRRDEAKAPFSRA